MSPLKIAAKAFAELHHKTIFGDEELVHPSATETIFMFGALWMRDQIDQTDERFHEAVNKMAVLVKDNDLEH